MMISKQRSCYVYIVLSGETEFVTAGKFNVSQNQDGIWKGEFIYSKTYLARGNAIELDPIELKLQPQHYETFRMDGFFGVIRDAMPDFWGRRVIERYNHSSGIEEFDYVLLGPDDRAGALGFGLNIKPPPPIWKFNQTLDLEFLQQAAEVISNENNSIFLDVHKVNQIHELLLQGTSMGGARPKVIIEDKNYLWIAKFSTPEDRWNQPVIEHGYLKLAKLCGLNVADSKLILVAKKKVLLVRRFDRDKTDLGYLRHRMASALTILKSEDNPIARKNWSYLIFADELRRISSNPKEDLQELFARMCFNAITSNLDDHPRNHAILAQGKNWRLSPAYDLTPSPQISQDKRFLAMTCGLYGRLAQRENLITGCERFLLSKTTAAKIIDNMVSIIKSKWMHCLKEAGASEKDLTTIKSAFLYPGFFYNTSE